MSRFSGRFFPALAALAAAGAGCFSGPEPAPPREALAQASARIDTLLGEFQAEGARPAAALGDSSTVRLWAMQHPLVSPALTAGALQRFHARNPGVTIDYQPLGEWTHAVQKLTVHIAGGGLPGIALVPRDWAASLMHSPRLASLEPILGGDFLDSLPQDARLAQTRVNGSLRALPADCFVTALYYWPQHVPEPPADWAALRRTAAALQGAKLEVPIASFPFLDALAGAGGTLVRDGASALDSEEALHALRFLLELRDNGLAHPQALRTPSHGLGLFRRGAAAMTVASTRHAPDLMRRGAFVAPVPGESGPVGRLESNVLIVFADAGASPKALAAVLRYLIAGPHADHPGNPTPFLEPVKRENPVPEALLAARLFAGEPAPRLPRILSVAHEAVDRAWRYSR